MALHGIGQGLQQRRRLADPAGERRAVEIDPLAGEDPGLAVERQVITVLRDQHMRQKAGTGAAALDRPRRQRRLVEALAAAAGQARAYDAHHHETAGDVLQLLRDILAQPLETTAAGGTPLARRQHRLFARQMARQGAALRLPLRAGRRLGQRLRRSGDLFVFQPELELVEGFRGGAEALPAQTRKLMLELPDQKIAVAQLDPRGQHHRLQRGDVIWQNLGFIEHDGTLPDRAAKGKLKWQSTYC